MRPEDATLVVQWRNHFETVKWLPQLKPLTIEEHEAFRVARIASGDILLTMEDHRGQAVGAGSLYNFNQTRELCEWGRLCSDQTSPLAMYDAIRIIHLWAFDFLGLKKIHCAAAEHNTRSRRLSESLGYIQEGFRPRHIKVNGQWLNVVEYGMFRENLKDSILGGSSLRE